MSSGWILLTICVAAMAGYWLGRRRAVHSVEKDTRQLHSLPHLHGAFVAMSGLSVSVLVFVIWSFAQSYIVSSQVGGLLQVQMNAEEVSLAMGDVSRLATGLDRLVALGALTSDQVETLTSQNEDLPALLSQGNVALAGEIDETMLVAAKALRGMHDTGNLLKTIAVLLSSLVSMGWAIRKISPAFRARLRVEFGVKAMLFASASLAIFTTFGIFMSLVFNSVNFFTMFPATDFLFGLTWSPEGRGGSEHLGIVPLLWGTVYISLIALLVAVPVGLFSAIFLAEYASRRTRNIIKPMLELLAGIPTIVYGLFALSVVGPLLVDIFGQNGLGFMQGARSVMTAGLVMGVMLIPFVSSLSDDVISAVPQALRDGSFGLGATRSETVKQVVLPAALPGVVGAILLAASRAIGETMIVVMGAGAAAKLDLNPFAAMTTVTAKIVSQLTGDSDFASPEALVAFSLGLTLFVLTLGINVFALAIVRKYREQYE